LLKNYSTELDIKLRQVTHLRIGAHHALEFGVEGKRLQTQYDNFYAGYTDALGDSMSALTLDQKIREQKLSAFVHFNFKPSSRLSGSLGARVDHFTYNAHTVWSPRLSLQYRLTDRSNLTAAAGVYYQYLPVLLLAQNDVNKKLSDPRAEHLVLGWEYLLTADTKTTVELYHKEYHNFPIDPQQPRLFLLDELYYRYGFFFNHGPLADKGRASASGIELTVQKKLAQNSMGSPALLILTRVIATYMERGETVFSTIASFSVRREDTSRTTNGSSVAVGFMPGVYPLPPSTLLLLNP